MLPTPKERSGGGSDVRKEAVDVLLPDVHVYVLPYALSLLPRHPMIFI